MAGQLGDASDRSVNVVSKVLINSGFQFFFFLHVKLERAYHPGWRIGLIHTLDIPTPRVDFAHEPWQVRKCGGLFFYFLKVVVLGA